MVFVELFCYHLCDKNGLSSVAEPPLLRIMKILRTFIVFHLLLCLLSCPAISEAASGESGKVDQKRNRFIGYLLSKQLPGLHFSDKVVNDELALAAFHIYIKQLDYQKRFLLKKDVEQLQAFAPYIDDTWLMVE